MTISIFFLDNRDKVLQDIYKTIHVLQCFILLFDFFITLFILPEYKATGPTEMPKFLMVSSGKSEENIKGTKIHAHNTHFATMVSQDVYNIHICVYSV